MAKANNPKKITVLDMQAHIYFLEYDELVVSGADKFSVVLEYLSSRF